MSTLISPSLGARRRTARRNVRGNPMHGPVLPVAALVRPHRPPHFTRSPGAPSKDAINSTWPDGLARATAHPYRPLEPGARRCSDGRGSGTGSKNVWEPCTTGPRRLPGPIPRPPPGEPCISEGPRIARDRRPSTRHATLDPMAPTSPKTEPHPSCTPAAKAPACKALVPFRGDSPPGTRRLRRHRRRRGRRPAHKRRAGRAAGSSSRHGPWPA